MRVLDLFSGTRSIEKALRPWDEYIGVDINEQLGKPDIQTDILKWDYKHSGYPRGYFDVIWAGVPCTEYSKMRLINIKKSGPPDIAGSNKIVKRTLAILRYFRPKYWIIENPDSGSLKDQAFMKKLPYIRVSYCMFGYPYKKTTRLWGNIVNFGDKVCNRQCGAFVGNQHVATIGGPSGTWIPRKQRNSYPPALIREIMEFCRPIRRSTRFANPVSART